MKKFYFILLAVFVFSLFSCNVQKKNVKPVTITIAGDYEKINALIPVIDAFQKKYSQYTVEYEQIDDYNKNLVKRLASSENAPHLFFTTAIKADSELSKYSLDLASPQSGIDLSNTQMTVTNNYKSGEFLYSVPIACTVRGVIVNKTLIESVGAVVPKNQAELIDACNKLRDKGYTPFYGIKDGIGQLLMYPWFCNTVAHDEAAFAKVAASEPGCGQVFASQIEFFYNLSKEGNIDYKTLSGSIESNMSAFFDGKIPFIPCAFDEGDLYFKYSETDDKFQANPFEFSFECAPVSPEGACGYISPWRGMAINKNNPDMEAAVTFLNFFLKTKQLDLFAESKTLVPNSKNMYKVMNKYFHIPKTLISDVGQATFPYGFYSDVKSVLF